MKKMIILFLLILLLCTAISCVGNKVLNTKNDEYLYIGGQRYNYKLSELEEIKEFRIYLKTYDEESDNNLKGIELLRNMNQLIIRGVKPWIDLGEIDFSPLGKLQKLKNIDLFYVTLNKFPDFSKIPSLEWIWIYDCKIKTMNGIEKNKQIKKLNIIFKNNYFGDLKKISELSSLEVLSISGNSIINDEWENTIIRVDDLSGLSGLKHLALGGVKNIDLEGIQNLSNLEVLHLDNSANIMNVHTLAGLKNLRELHELVISPDISSLGILEEMKNLSELSIYGSGNTIDITSLENLPHLKILTFFNLTIMNFHILDNLTELEQVYILASSFYPENNNKLHNAVVYYGYDEK